ncbi:hypothetical protein [Glutamicibacter sp.]|uniref:hypothetical protein n=1 Tax=Glutamicibacter sp. TaxID=1931995 RepID=UPI002B493111|nr:hypothetical protein [Glutamicibacter sp.]HJX79175.1 hypothetical protein [Glutamicibacter sp.]
MRPPNIFDDPAKWEEYLRQCNLHEIKELEDALGDIAGIIIKLMQEDLEKI